RRAADHLEHISGSGLLLKRFTQLAKQACVLNRNNRLRGEVRNKFDLLIGKRTNLLAINYDRTDKLAVLKHWNGDQGTRPSKFDGRGLSFSFSAVRDMHCRLRGHHLGEAAGAHRLERPALLPEFNKRRWDACTGNGVKELAVEPKQRPESGVANAGCVFEHRTEHGFQRTWRT